MEEYTSRDINVSSNDNISGDASDKWGTVTNDKVAEGRHPTAGIQMHQRLMEMRERLDQADKLFAQMANLRDQIAEELTGLLQDLPSSVKLMNISNDTVDDESFEAGFVADTAAIDSRTPVIIPKIQFKSWNEIAVPNKARVLVPEEAFAIEIASDEPIGTFKPGMPWKEATFDAYAERSGLPERLRINSPPLKRLLLGDDSGLDNQRGRSSTPPSIPLTILRPFKMLDYQYSGLKIHLEASEKELSLSISNTIASQENSSNKIDVEVSELRAAVEDLRCLVTYMDDSILPTKARLEKESDIVFFSDLWYVFPPDSVIYVKRTDFIHKIWRVIQRTGGRRYMTNPTHIPESIFQHQFSSFVVDCYFIDYDGKHFVPVFGQFEIAFFDSAAPLSSLPIFPLRIAEKDGLVRRDELEARAWEFIANTKLCHRHYVGWSHTRTPDGKQWTEVEQRFDSEVVVDYLRAIEQFPSWKPSGDDPQLYSMDHAELDGTAQDIDQDWKWDKRVSDDILTQLKETLLSWTNPTEVPDQKYLLLLPDRVFAYVLRNRRWASLRVGKTKDGDLPLCFISTVTNPWQELHLPRGHKEIIQALIQNHSASFQDLGKAKSTFETDIIRGKGAVDPCKGLIMLLHGPPGVGKTSTAECAAAATGRPLFPITCGDLGISPEKLEADLSCFFGLAESWGCVLLLDEADVFLSQRDKTNIARNGLVSVFLRTLEYYSGVLFLTTNRAGAIDSAFKSRVHLSLYYPSLDRQGTSVIWRNNIARAKSVNRELEVDEKTLLEYAVQLFDTQNSDPSHGPAWNGREIRNAFQSAIALANFQKTPGSSPKLTPEHFQKVSETSDNFNKYLADTLGYQLPAEPNKVVPRRHQTRRIGSSNAGDTSEASSNHSSVSGSSDTWPARARRKGKAKPALETAQDSTTHSNAEKSSDAGSFGRSVNQMPSWTPSQAPMETLHHLPVYAPGFLSQQQHGIQPNQAMGTPVAFPNAQVQQQPPLPAWPQPQGMVLMPVNMAYGLAGMPMQQPLQQPLQMPTPIMQYQNAAMNPHGMGTTGPTMQIPTEPLRGPFQYSNSFQSPFSVPQVNQSIPRFGDDSRQQQSQEGSGGGFWGRLDQN
ncbi:hypothetical protein F5Y12DRAFT_720843 [Xylaria sp. FL1777]|nr:hypothetical protein F5Y12DRAFT_720843 [Xylaria sp. FL1777]